MFSILNQFEIILNLSKIKSIKIIFKLETYFMELIDFVEEKYSRYKEINKTDEYNL